MDYNRKKHGVYLLTYHIIFVTKYRKPVISPEIGDAIKKQAAHLTERMGGELLSAETDADHIHMLISLPPDIVPVQAIRNLKTELSKYVHKTPEYMKYVHRYLHGDAPFWSASYFIATTGSVSMETVKSYIESQRSEEHQKRKYEKSNRYATRRKWKNT